MQKYFLAISDIHVMGVLWLQEIDADNSLETIEDGIFSHALMTVQSVEASSLYRLWDDLWFSVDGLCLHKCLLLNLFLAEGFFSRNITFYHVWYGW